MPRTTGGTFTDDARARMIALHGQGESLNAIARELGYSPATISRHAARAGLTWDRAPTKVAVAARRLDRAATRADLIDRLYRLTDRVLTRLEAPEYQHRAPSGMGETRLWTDPVAPARDEKDLAAAAGLHLANAAKLEALDGTGHDDARAMLTTLGKALGIA